MHRQNHIKLYPTLDEIRKCVVVSHFRLILDKNDSHNRWRFTFIANAMASNRGRKTKAKNSQEIFPTLKES